MNLKNIFKKQYNLHESLPLKTVKNKKANAFEQELDEELNTLQNTPYTKGCTSTYFNSKHNKWKDFKKTCDLYDKSAVDSYITLIDKQEEENRLATEYARQLILDSEKVGQSTRDRLRDKTPIRSQFAYKNKIRNFKQKDNPSTELELDYNTKRRVNFFNKNRKKF